jgi:uncharacterized C2H2 Zn-finger protein
MKYDCPMCSKKFQSENDLNRHLKKIHKIENSESIVREITIGDLFNYDEEKVKQ